MDIKNIYERIDINQLAEYQIKVKGDVEPLQRLVLQYASCSFTTETTDTDYQICMITVPRINQRNLFALVNLLIRNHYPVISVFCSQIEKKADSGWASGDAQPPVKTA